MANNMLRVLSEDEVNHLLLAIGHYADATTKRSLLIDGQTEDPAILDKLHFSYAETQKALAAIADALEGDVVVTIERRGGT